MSLSLQCEACESDEIVVATGVNSSGVGNALDVSQIAQQPADTVVDAFANTFANNATWTYQTPMQAQA
jgi:hypothetical protein